MSTVSASFMAHINSTFQHKQLRYLIYQKRHEHRANRQHCPCWHPLASCSNIKSYWVAYWNTLLWWPTPGLPFFSGLDRRLSGFQSWKAMQQLCSCDWVYVKIVSVQALQHPGDDTIESVHLWLWVMQHKSKSFVGTSWMSVHIVHEKKLLLRHSVPCNFSLSDWYLCWSPICYCASPIMKPVDSFETILSLFTKQTCFDRGINARLWCLP